VEIDCQKSSQYLSALLLLAPVTPRGLQIRVAGKMVSRPYVALTVALMKTFGIRIYHADYREFEVPGSQSYRAGTYTVEADCSQAAYFWGAAAITGAHITVKDVNPNSVQGDLRFLDLLEQMGCTILRDSAGIGVVGGRLRALEVDLANMPDQVPTLAVVTAFAEGTSRIKNIAHLKTKESNRLAATITELNKMGIETGQSGNTLIVKGGRPRGAVIDTYDDHRIAMSFSLAGLKVPGISIRNEACVSKSFPGFWSVFKELYRS
jgi:3-phosphoshikimate 1-carboxyvinyltransferase